eukprot:9497229-Pyramimonas_sp.AAC.1
MLTVCIRRAGGRQPDGGVAPGAGDVDGGGGAGGGGGAPRAGGGGGGRGLPERADDCAGLHGHGAGGRPLRLRAPRRHLRRAE